ncbi:MAG: CopG family ribbon-helix-helix protein [Deltaproteobacteria bacterium]|nr:CopG family ribbon-helix-helix protein [Deltaproteobacteria bacterium]
MTTTAVAIKIDQKTKERYKKLARIKDRSAHWMMREAINQYVDREEKRESFRQDAVNSWNEYQETGLHATGNEVIEWLNSWGTDDEKDVPECHQ